MVQRRLDDLFAGKGLDLLVKLAHGLVGDLLARREQHGGRHAVVFGLAHQVGGQKAGIRAVVGDN